MANMRLADPRIPDPHTQTGLACQTNPDLFTYDLAPTDTDDRRRVARARRVCGGCPIAAECLKWALANPSLTQSGIWAATTPGQRTNLRRRLRARLGTDWIGVVAAADRARALRSTARPPAPVDVPAAHPLWSQPYEPWRQPVTPEQQEQHRQTLERAQYTPRPRRRTRRAGVSLAEAR